MLLFCATTVKIMTVCNRNQNDTSICVFVVAVAFCVLLVNDGSFIKWKIIAKE